MISTDVVGSFFLSMFLFVLLIILTTVFNHINKFENSRNIFWSLFFIITFAVVMVKVW